MGQWLPSTWPLKCAVKFSMGSKHLMGIELKIYHLTTTSHTIALFICFLSILFMGYIYSGSTNIMGEGARAKP